MSISKLPDDTELRRLYIDEQLPMEKIGQMFGVSRQRVHQRIQPTGIVRPKRILDRADLEQLYVQKKLPIYKVAQALGVSSSFVLKTLHRYGIPLRYKKCTFDYDHLYRLYVTEGMIMIEIAEKFGCNVGTVANELVRNGIFERHNPAVRRKKPFTRDQLYSLYVEQGLSTKLISESVGCDPKNVVYWLRKFEIPLRVINSLVGKEQVLRKLFLKHKMPVGLIGEKLGVTASCVHKNLRRFGITTPAKRKTNKPPA